MSTSKVLYKCEHVPEGFVDGTREREERHVLFVERPVPRGERDGQHHLREGRHEVHQPEHAEHVEQLKPRDQVLRNPVVVRALGQLAHGPRLVADAVPFPF